MVKDMRTDSQSMTVESTQEGRHHIRHHTNDVGIREKAHTAMRQDIEETVGSGSAKAMMTNSRGYRNSTTISTTRQVATSTL